MATEKRIKIITESEVQELYSPLPLTASDQRFFFALDDRAAQEECKKLRQRRSRCMLTLLLGYFKAKMIYKKLRLRSKLRLLPGTISI